MDIYIDVCVSPRASWMPVPVVSVYPNRKTLPTISYLFHTIISLVKYLCFFSALSCTCAGLFKKSNRILFSTLTLMMFCWHICVRESHYFSSWILKHFSSRHSLPLCFSSPPNFTPFPSLLPPHDTAMLASGMEMRCTVALCQRAADWTLAWMVQQMFADFFIQISPEYWLGSQGCRESSAVDTCSINPTWCVHVFGCDCMNYHKYEMEFSVSVCAICVFLCVCACGPGEHENREQQVRFSRL